MMLDQQIEPSLAWRLSILHATASSRRQSEVSYGR